MLEMVLVVLFLAWPVLLVFGIFMVWAVGMAICDAMSSDPAEEKDEPKEPPRVGGHLLIQWPPKNNRILCNLRHRLLTVRVLLWGAAGLVFINWLLGDISLIWPRWIGSAD